MGFVWSLDINLMHTALWFVTWLSVPVFLLSTRVYYRGHCLLCQRSLLWLSLLVGKTAVVSLLKERVQGLYSDKWLPCKQLQLARVNHCKSCVLPSESNDRAGQLLRVYKDEGILLKAEVCKEICVSSKIFCCLLGSISFWWSCCCVTLRTVAKDDFITGEKATLVEVELDIV